MVRISHFLFFIALCTGCASVRARFSAEPVRAPDSTDGSSIALGLEEERAFSLMNKLRADADMPLLKLDASLQKAAALHSRYMSTKKIYEHIEKSDTPEHVDRINKAGGKFMDTAENINCSTTAEQAVSSWDASREHRNTMMSIDYESVGISFQGNKGKLEGLPGCTRNAFWTVVFGGNGIE